MTRSIVENTNKFAYNTIEKECMLHINKTIDRIILLVPIEQECTVMPKQNKFYQ